MTQTSKTEEMPRRGGSFLRDKDGKLIQTAGPALAPKPKSGRSKKTPAVEKKGER
ncbi:hypothetical protein [Cognatiyoonia sp. IB215182]|uniref:hypothetical protein n=1 Tax=Cognatiyoonia sp. IB215182 TaxID=3097353 RepID=UPI002A1533CB|nr:hypothetical protein [Cognatiyoonia sp. IB215182]MDX8354356.1 hypothetical protein [Cognatiyoonia sp. IB215182]